eukprot:2805169-Pleurochrysis_carterae.AAC.1
MAYYIHVNYYFGVLYPFRLLGCFVERRRRHRHNDSINFLLKFLEQNKASQYIVTWIGWILNLQEEVDCHRGLTQELHRARE